MRQLRAWIVRIAAELGFGRPDRRFNDEIASHLQLHVDDNTRSGMSASEARRAALIALGGSGGLREEYRDQAGLPVVRLLADAGREGLRSLVRRPAFSVVVIGILSLGVGAASAMVSLVDTLLFRPPAHVADPDRLVQVVGGRNYVVFQTIQENVHSLDVAAVSGAYTLSLGEGEDARPIEAECVTSNYFRVLGTTAPVGRTFQPEEGTRGGEPLAVLGYGLWRRELGSDIAITSRTMTIAGRSHRVVGVAPPDFRGLGKAPIDAWILLTASPEVCSLSGRSLLDSAAAGWLTTVGRLRDGADLERAEAEARSLNLLAGFGAGVGPQRALVPVQARQRLQQGDGRLAVWLAVGAGILLAIACANVGGLLAVRAIERRREVAFRMQLGASRARIFTQLLAENMVLAVGCTLGAWAIFAAMTRILRTSFSALVGDIWFDGRGVSMVVAFALGAGFISGLLPAVQASRTSVSHLRSPALGLNRTRWRDVLIVVQVTLALVLVFGAGLFARSAQRAKSNVGYELDRVIVATLDLERSGIRRQLEQRRLFDEILTKVRSVPGVEAVSLSTAGPLGSGHRYAVMPSLPGTDGAATLNRMVADVSPDYFRTVGTRILSGRPFTAADGPGAPRVAIVDTDLARAMWPGEQVVGLCKAMAPGRSCVDIVGLSEPRRMQSLARADGEIFYPLTQSENSVPQAILVRSTGKADDTVPRVAAAIRQASSALPFVSVSTLEDLADVQARSWRLGAMLFGLFGGVALILAAVGLYASLAFIVRQRTAEIGLRMALGAVPRQAAGAVFWHGARLTCIGWVMGLGMSLGLGVWIQSRLFGVTAADPATLVAASIAVGIAGMSGCVLPVLRAARVDPVVALRNE